MNSNFKKKFINYLGKTFTFRKKIQGVILKAINRCNNTSAVPQASEGRFFLSGILVNKRPFAQLR